MQILHFEVCLPLQKFSAAATTRGNRVRSNHRSSCFQLEGTCAFRKLAPAKLDRLGRDLIFFQEGMRRDLMHFTLLYHTNAGLKSELGNTTTERRNEQIQSYGVRLPRAPKFVPSTRFYPPPNPKANWICLRNAATERKSYNNVIPLQRDPPISEFAIHLGNNLMVSPSLSHPHSLLASSGRGL